MNFANVLYDNNDEKNAANNFNPIIVTMNLIMITQFFECICKNIFEHLLIAKFFDDDVFDSISTYFEIVKINNRDMLHLHCFI